MVRRGLPALAPAAAPPEGGAEPGAEAGLGAEGGRERVKVLPVCVRVYVCVG